LLGKKKEKRGPVERKRSREILKRKKNALVEMMGGKRKKEWEFGEKKKKLWRFLESTPNPG